MSRGLFSILQQRKNLLRIAGHGAWLFSDLGLRMALGLVVGAVVARYLGPDSFGTLSLVFAYVMLFSSAASLGLDRVVVRDLVKEPGATNAILGTVFGIKCACAAAAFILGNAVIRAIDSSIEGLWVLVAIGSCSLFFCAVDTVDYLFQSRLNGRAIVFARSSAFVVSSLVKLALVLAGAPLIFFATTPVIEAAVAAALLVLAYVSREGSLRQWKFEGPRARALVWTVLPAAASDLIVMAITQIDKLMLDRLAGAYSVGIYSAASFLSTVWYMVPIVVGASVAPTLTSLYEKDRAEYARRLQDVFSVLTLATLGVGAVTTALSQPLIGLIFGDAYSGAALVLAIHVWTGLFIAHVSIRSRALLIEGRLDLVLVISALTLAANVLLNLVLIERYAETGAACASLISWGLSALLFPLFMSRTRGFVRMMLISLAPASWARALAR